MMKLLKNQKLMQVKKVEYIWVSSAKKWLQMPRYLNKNRSRIVYSRKGLNKLFNQTSYSNKCIKT